MLLMIYDLRELMNLLKYILEPLKNLLLGILLLRFMTQMGEITWWYDEKCRVVSIRDFSTCKGQKSPFTGLAAKTKQNKMVVKVVGEIMVPVNLGVATGFKQGLIQVLWFDQPLSIVSASSGLALCSKDVVKDVGQQLLGLFPFKPPSSRKENILQLLNKHPWFQRLDHPG